MSAAASPAENSCWFARVERLGAAVITGRDRQRLLHNLCTQELKSLSTGRGAEAFFLDVKGRILAHGVVLLGEDEALVLSLTGLAALADHLNRYVISEDAAARDATEELSWLAAGGETAGCLAALATGEISLAENWSWQELRWKGSETRLVRCELLGPGGMWWGVPATAVVAAERSLLEAGACPIDQLELCRRRFAAAWPLPEVDYDRATLPQELGRNDAALNFRKGCYLGQETVARLDALGHVNRRLTKLRAESIATFESAREVRAGDAILGQVTSWVALPNGDALALAMLRTPAYEPGRQLRCGDQPVTVVPLIDS